MLNGKNESTQKHACLHSDTEQCKGRKGFHKAMDETSCKDVEASLAHKKLI